MYADYAYYKSTYGGTMSEDDFALCAEEASRRMDALTFSRAADAPSVMQEPLRRCCCEAADAQLCLVQAASATQGGLLASASTDGYSESYAYADAMRRAQADVQCICTRWLTRPVNLMYRGV